MYGPAFLTAYAAADNDAGPNPLWARTLSSLRPDQARHGLEKLSRQGRQYPPNLSEVMEACLNRPIRSYGTQALPAPQSSRWARMANVTLLTFLYGGRRPIQPVCEYPLDAFLATKREIVTAAERAEADGDPWDKQDFQDVLKTAFGHLVTRPVGRRARDLGDDVRALLRTAT